MRTARLLIRPKLPNWCYSRRGRYVLMTRHDAGTNRGLPKAWIVRCTAIKMLLV